jgi:polyisoprenoid-binding protein YceI
LGGEGYVLDPFTPVGTVSDRPSSSSAHALVLVPVASFDCGDKRMNRDFTAAMKAEAFPEISFELIKAAVFETAKNEETSLKIGITGRLSIAGTERTVALTISAWDLGDGRYRAQGHVPLRMSTFGVDPPSALLGLIKARDDILVRFDLVASMLTVNATE